MNNMQTQELISALADGQLQGEAFARGVEAAVSDPVARDTWLTYHLIGDVLRSGEHVPGMAPSRFLDRLQERLQSEPRQGRADVALAVTALGETAPAANDANFRWKLVAGFASVTAVAAIGWTVAGGFGQPQQVQLAATPSSQVLAQGERGVMIRDARLDEFLAAHRQLGGASALQMPAGFLRNATFEGPVR